MSKSFRLPINESSNSSKRRSDDLYSHQQYPSQSQINRSVDQSNMYHQIPNTSTIQNPNLNGQQLLQPLRALMPSPHPIYSMAVKQRQTGSMRNRTMRACDLCRRKKIKCNTNGPGSTCKYCDAFNALCTFNDSLKKPGPSKGYTEVLEDRVKRIEQLLGTIADGYQSQQEENTKSVKKRKLSIDDENHQNTSDQSTSSLQSPIESRYIDDDQINNKDNIKTANENVGSCTTRKKSEITEPLIAEISSLSTEFRSRFIGDMNPIRFLRKKLNIKESLTIEELGYTIKRNGESLILYETKDDNSDKNGNQRFLEKLRLLKPGETIKGLNDWIYKVAGVDKSTSDSLMKIYFAYVHPGLPVVNKYLFLKQYRGEIGGEYPSAQLLNSMYGAAMRYVEACKNFGDEIDIPTNCNIRSEVFFENAIIYLKSKFSPCISTVQAVLIGQNHKFGLDDGVGITWLLSSMAIRMSQDLGLHRSCNNWNIPTSEKETRKRVWWSVYIMDRWSSAGTGRPQTIFDDDCDVGYPSESADWEEVMDLPSKDSDDEEDENNVRFPSLYKEIAQKAKNNHIPIYQPFVQLGKLSEILGKILQGLYTPLAKQHSEKYGSDAIVTYIERALTEWRNALPPGLQISNINVNRLNKHGNTPLLGISGIVYLSYYTVVTLLHRPFIEKNSNQTTTSSQSSLNICTSAATQLVDIALNMNYNDFLLVSWNFGIYPVFTASLIHINNATNSDKIIADAAKTNLLKGAAIIQRLSRISSAASQLNKVLSEITKLRDIKVDLHKIHENLLLKYYANPKQVPRVEVALNSKPAIQQQQDDHNRKSPESVNQMTDPVNSFVSSNMKDSRVDSVHNISEYDEQVNSKTSTISDDWINDLYTVILPNTFNQDTNQQPQIQAIFQQPLHSTGLNMEQFGMPLNKDCDHDQKINTPLIYQENDVQQHTNVSTTSGMPLGMTNSNMYAPLNTGLNIPSNTMFPATYPQPDTTLMDQSLFRNRPDNAFWSMPSTIKLDDWMAYLLPQQSTDPNPNTESSSTWHPSQSNWM